jgi:hypothetical protein
MHLIVCYIIICRKDLKFKLVRGVLIELVDILV